MFFVNFIRENIDKNVKIVSYHENLFKLLSSVCGNIFHIAKIKAKVKIMYLGENLSRGPYTKWKRLLNFFLILLLDFTAQTCKGREFVFLYG